MRKYLFALVLVVLVSAGASRALALGTVVDADIPFAFSIVGNQLPAGSYEFTESSTNPDILAVRNASTGKEIMVQCTTRLAARGDEQNVVVFDHAGDQNHLSEIHLAGMDGYYFKAASGKHTHTTIKARKKA